MNGLQTSDELILSLKKRMVVQRIADETGRPELHLYYGDKDISFDEPELFTFGEALAEQSQFAAGDAVAWGQGQSWQTIRPLLEHLLEEGVLKHADDISAADQIPDMVRPSPLPPAPAAVARSWVDECEAITGDLTGCPVELGYLELIIPVFRVAHIALDADGRQVGEANVFPRALRVERPTNWLTCAYPGTRYMNERPMNVTALKAMRLHWKQMMATLLRIRAAFLTRFPDARAGWTVGRVERLATLVLAVPTYQLVKANPISNGTLHPALSSLFRVTDGLRMTMHQMLFVPIGEPTMSPDAPLTSDQIFDYAERNYSFHSETGVCGGPRHMIQQFMRVLLDGEGAETVGNFSFDADVASALADMDTAFDYGLRGLQVYGAFFSLWPAMTRAYEELAGIAEAAVTAGFTAYQPLRDRLQGRVHGMKTGTYLATEEWRSHRERVYADMYEQCGLGLSRPESAPPLTDQLTPRLEAAHTQTATTLAAVVDARFGASTYSADLTRRLMTFFIQEQAIIRAACTVQSRINEMLGRPTPTRAFGAAEADVHNLLQGADVRRLPYLVDEIADVLDLDIRIDTDCIDLTDRRNHAAAM